MVTIGGIASPCPRGRRVLTRLVPAAVAAGRIVGTLRPRPIAGLAAAYPSADVSLTGHGWGPGNGMGQWGALGYALQGLTYQQILSTYYGTLSAGGQTTLGPLPNGWEDATTDVTVAMTENAGNDVIVTSGSAFSVDGTPLPAGSGALFHLPDRRAPVWTVETSPASTTPCAGPWTTMATGVAAPDRHSRAPSPSRRMATCGQRGSHAVHAAPPASPCAARSKGPSNSNDDARTVNVLPLGQYVAGRDAVGVAGFVGRARRRCGEPGSSKPKPWRSGPT